jgi:hypothetical protein
MPGSVNKPVNRQSTVFSQWASYLFILIFYTPRKSHNTLISIINKGIFQLDTKQGLA